MEEGDQNELQLLPTPHSIASSSDMQYRMSDSWLKYPSTDPSEGSSSLDLQLSISLRPIQPQSEFMVVGDTFCDYGDVEALRWQAAEHIRLAAIETTYAEQVRELTRREMELAQSEFLRARQLWERAREKVEKAERMKDKATRRVGSTCMEITCQSCRQRFRP